ncbi:MAG: 3-deoxy-manno-octulosonate cytidylyltransferase [Pseudomonadota bacterium]
MFSVIIPARYQSARLPGKPLALINGKPMVQQVYEQAQKSDAQQVIVATDDARVAQTVDSFGGQACMTSSDHISGTDRLQEVVNLYNFSKDDIVVNVQGDEPFIPPEVINQVAHNLYAQPAAAAATLCEPMIKKADLFDPNIVKVVYSAGGSALYFSRAGIPCVRDGNDDPVQHAGLLHRHIGIYAYRVKTLDDFVSWPPAPLELAEKLEQLRLLYNDRIIHVDRAIQAVPGGIDTPDDLQRVQGLFV